METYNMRNAHVYLTIWHKIMHVRKKKEKYTAVQVLTIQYNPWRKEELKLSCNLLTVDYTLILLAGLINGPLKYVVCGKVVKNRLTIHVCF